MTRETILIEEKKIHSKKNCEPITRKCRRKKPRKLLQQSEDLSDASNKVKEQMIKEYTSIYVKSIIIRSCLNCK